MKKRKIISFLLALCICFSALPITAQAASSYNAGNAVAYAASHWNDGVGLCAEFVSNCLRAGGLSSWNRECTNLYNQLNNEVVGGARIASVQYLTTSGNYIRTSDNAGKISKGDVLFWLCSGCPTDSVGGPYQHTALVSDVSGTYVKVYQHNGAVNNQPAWVGNCYECGRRYSHMVVIHFGSSSAPTVKEYFSCNVEIRTTKGKTVNLYSKPTDSTRKTYFDQGQTAYSTRGAKLSNGTTWYEIQAIDNGKVVTLWLNAASSGVTIINKKVEPSLTFSPSSLSMNVGTSKTVSIKFAGDGIQSIGGTINGQSLCDVSWGGTNWSAGTTSLTVTGKKAGTATITVNLMDKDGKTICSKSFTATITDQTYTVSYNANGGSGAPASQTKTYGKALTLSSQKPTRTGYTFKGWATSANSSTVSYQLGGTYTGNSNLTLYAVWAPSTLTVKEYFSCNVQINTTKGKTVNLYSSPTDSTRKTYFDQGQTAYSTRGAKLSDGSTWYEIQAIDNGKVVTLWLNAASSGIKIIDKKIDPSLSFSPSSLSLDLGTSKTVSITFKGDGIYNLSYGIGDSSVCSASWGSVDYSTGKTSLTVTGKSGGSTKITIYLNDKNGKSLYSQSINVTVTAPTYTVSYNANGGSGAPSPQTKQYDKTLTLSSTKPTRSGYTFMGWATSSGASSAQYQPGSSYTSNKNLTLYAVWERNKIDSSLTFSPSSLTMDPGSSKTVSISFKGEDIEKLHYTIHNSSVCDLSWGSTDLGKGTSSLTVTGKNPGTATVTVYLLDDEGKFFFSQDFSVTVNSQSYTVSYNANGGSGAPSPQTKQYNKTLTLSSTKPTRDGYTFIGWAESPDASSAQVQYHPGDIYTENKNLTLYAVWMTAKPDHQHDLSYKRGVSSTCTEGGTQAYWSCAGCGKRFTDSSANREITDIHLDPLGHNYVDGICTRCGAADPNAAAPSVTEVHLPRQTIYFQDQFIDVYENQWFTKNVSEAYELGLMVGTSSNTFSPYGDVTLAQAITMACRIHSIYQDGYENIPKSDGAWYQSYLDYAYRNGIIDWAYYNAEVENKATRAQFAQIMANALPDEGFCAINSVTDNSIPDVSMSENFSSAVYKLYRAGILSGGDVNGTFSPRTYITRAEAAAVVSRIAESSNRVSFSLS